VLAGFVLFRVFDIWKPWPVRWADRRLHGGFGAMLDDVFAGLYAALTLQAIALIPHITEHGALA
jgi:phosphatidylglycerophosphatase A